MPTLAVTQDCCLIRRWMLKILSYKSSFSSPKQSAWSASFSLDKYCTSYQNVGTAQSHEPTSLSARGGHSQPVVHYHCCKLLVLITLKL